MLGYVTTVFIYLFLFEPVDWGGQTPFLKSSCWWEEVEFNLVTLTSNTCASSCSSREEEDCGRKSVKLPGREVPVVVTSALPQVQGTVVFSNSLRYQRNAIVVAGDHVPSRDLSALRQMFCFDRLTLEQLWHLILGISRVLLWSPSDLQCQQLSSSTN